MKTDKFILAALVISGALALGGCSNDSDNQPQPQSSFPADGLVHITTGITDLTTRAGITNDNIHTKTIGFFFETPRSDKYTYSNIKMEYKDGSWQAIAASDGSTPAPVMYWKDKETLVRVRAYAPWKANMTFIETLKYEGVADQSTPEAIEDADLVIYGAFVNPTTDLTDGNISLTLRHILSKMVLELTIGEDVKEAASEDVTITDVRIKGLAKSGEIGLDGTVISMESTPDFAIAPLQTSGSDPLTGTGTTNYEAVFLPQYVDSNQLSVEVTLSDGKTYVYTLGEECFFRTNTLYTLPIQVGTTTQAVSFLKANITADPWDTNGTDLGNKTTD